MSSGIYNQQQFISVLTVPSSGDTGNLSIQIQDFTFNNTLTLSVSALNNTDNEDQLAWKINTQLNTFIVQNNVYFGSNSAPYYVDLNQVQQYIVTGTDHCVSMWGETNFKITIPVNTTGAIIQSDDNPTLLTVSVARELAEIKGVDLITNSGTTMTDAQLAIALKLASSKMIGFTRNKIVQVANLMTLTADWVWGVRLPKTPAVDFYPPQVRIPIAFNLFSAITYNTVKGNYAFERDGWLTYRFAQSIVNYPEPFDGLNDILLVYISGYGTIPNSVENVILELIPVITAQVPMGIESMRGGTFEIKYGGVQEVYNNLMMSLREYFLTD